MSLAMRRLLELHKEGNARVTYILSRLEKVKLAPKFRGSEIIQLENIITATMEDWLYGSCNVIMHRAERKLQLSHDVIGDDSIDKVDTLTIKLGKEGA
ncbi:hypothetical protein Tco_0915060 [Tanacetum coccineum]